jgi:signal transduction histidine kinase
MKLKILLIEDNNDDADLLVRSLKRDKLEFLHERVETREEFIEALDRFKPDVILSDHSLPQFDSLTALEIAKKRVPNVPFILVTGTVSEEFAVTCIKSGADDYILKKNMIRLTSAIHKSLEKHSLASENTVIKALNAEIKKKNDELHYMNQEKDRFMGIISHDLQNHISSMILVLKQMEEETGQGKKDKKEVDYIKLLSRSVSNMQKLLTDFLTVNRIQSGIIKPLYSLVNIGGLVNEVIEGYEYLASRKNIKIKYTNKCPDSFYRTDMSYLSIIADNLISNAIKYTGWDKEVEVSLLKGEGKYQVQVRNEGEVIPPSDMLLLYGRFQKLTPKPTAGEPSNGLGLSIVKDLVGALNATIDCKSAEGQTTFTVTFN